ncbi:MAG: acylphosphatase [Patescibacteria group bacterium]
MRLKLKIIGQVQGVWYRAGAMDVARGLGLTGYAKNLPDNSVEVVAAGEKQNLEKLKHWCAHGPTGAQVEKIEEEWSDTKESFEDFKVL